MNLSLPDANAPASATPPTALTVNETQLVHQALRVMEQRLFQRGPYLENAKDARHYQMRHFSDVVKAPRRSILANTLNKS